MVVCVLEEVVHDFRRHIYSPPRIDVLLCMVLYTAVNVLPLKIIIYLTCVDC